MVKFSAFKFSKPDMQMLFKFQVNSIKIEDFRNLAYVDILVYVDLLAYVYLKKLIGGWIWWPDMTNFTELQCMTVAVSVTLISENLRMVGWAVWAGGEQTD